MVQAILFFILFFFCNPRVSAHNDFRVWGQLSPTTTQINSSDFRCGISVPVKNNNSCRNYSNDCYRSPQEWEYFFTVNNMSEQAILGDAHRYSDANYIAAAKKLPLYATYVKKYAQQYARYSCWKRAIEWGKGTYRIGLARTFEALNKECEQEAARRTQEEKRAKAVIYKKQQEAVVHERKMRERAVYQNLQSVVNNQAISDASPVYTRQQSRAQALERTLQEEMKRMARTFECDVRACSFAKSYGISGKSLKSGTMNAYQYQLQTECIKQLSVAAGLHDRYSTDRRVSIFLDAVGDSVGQSVLANQSNQVEIATTWTDVGWQALDIAQAMVEGVCLGTANVAAIVLHPIHTGQAMIHSMTTMANLLARATGTVAHLAYLEFKGDHDHVCAQLHDIVSELDRQIDHCCKEFDRIPNREKVKYATAFATEMILPAKALRVASGIASGMRPLIVECIEVMRKEEAVVELAGTGQKILLQASEGVQQVGGSAAKASPNLIKNEILGGEFAKNTVSNASKYESLNGGSLLGIQDKSKLVTFVKNGKELVRDVPIPQSSTGIIKNFEVTKKHFDHIFSENHKLRGILDLGNNELDILDKCIDFVKKADGQGLLKIGPNQMNTLINGHQTTIRMYVKDGGVLSLDIFKGLTERSLGNTFTFYN